MYSSLIRMAAVCALVCAPVAVAVAQDDESATRGPIKHVLLLSIDGMHAVDYYNCVHGIAGVNGGAPYCPHLASLGKTGLNYVATSTSRPSDSFPGLMSIVTGATPKTMGIYYDVAYDRSLDPPKTTTGNGVAGGTCTTGTPTGTTTEYEEGIDRDQTLLNGGAPGAGLTDGGIASIDPDKLPRDPHNGCAPVYPWNFVRVNTIYNVIHASGGYTAWSDKHPAYSSVAGPGDHSLDDYYSPEINSNVVALPGVQTPEGVSCAVVRDPNSDLTAWTNSFSNIQCYDTLKVNAILNEIHGKTHNGAAAKVPTIFGMNFQAVSVGQKLIEGSVRGGYTDAAGTPTTSLFGEMTFVDDAIGEMVSALQSTGQLNHTLIIVTAKHGQSPIDPNLYSAHPGKTSNGTTPATLLASYLPDSESPLTPGGIGPTEDDISLLWLKNSSDVPTAVNILETNGTAIGLGQIFYGPTVALNYNTPGLGPGLDPRTPDIIVTPNVGVTYTGSAKKLEEHGGFAHDDTNVMLLLSNPKIDPQTISTPTTTSQVAPSILTVLGINPAKLDAVRLEGTTALPGVSTPQD